MPSIPAYLLAVALSCAPIFVQAWAREKSPAAAPRGPARSELAPAGAGWVKVCFDDPQTRRQTCYTTRDFAEEGGTPILSLEVFETKGEDLMVRVFLPLGLALKPGVRVGLERGEPESGAFEACFPAGCYASSNVPVGLMDAMRRGGRFLISVKKLSGEELGFLLPLEGFGKAFDGPAAGPEELRSEGATRLQHELSEKAAAEGRKVEEGAAKPPADSTKR